MGDTDSDTGDDSSDGDCTSAEVFALILSRLNKIKNAFGFPCGAGSVFLHAFSTDGRQYFHSKRRKFDGRSQT